MTFITVLKVLGAVAALAYGLWAGFGRYRQSHEEVDKALDEEGDARRMDARRVDRHYTPLDFMGRLTGVPIERERRRTIRLEREEVGKTDGRAEPREGEERGEVKPGEAKEGTGEDEGEDEGEA